MKTKRGKTKRRMLAILLVLVLAVSMVLPGTGGTNSRAAEGSNGQTFTFDDENFYHAVRNMLVKPDNKAAEIAHDDDSKTLTINMEKVTLIYLRKTNMAEGNSLEIFETMIRNCPNLSTFKLDSCTLDGFDFSVLNSRADSMKNIFLGKLNLNQVPELKLPNLEILCLCKNDLSQEGACANITAENFPKLTQLYLDKCSISDLRFLNQAGKLKFLSLGDNKLTDDSVQDLISMSAGDLSGLEKLNIGKRVENIDGTGSYAGESAFRYTDIAKVASLPEHFRQLVTLRLEDCRITSLSGFSGVRKNVSFGLDYNKIIDFGDIEDFSQFSINAQSYTIPGTFIEGQTCEIEDEMIQRLLQRIMDENDTLHGTIECKGCSISDDGKMLTIQSKPEKEEVKVGVTGGALVSSSFSFTYKLIPPYSIPQNVTAAVGDTLRKVTLPKGFTWKEPNLVLKEEGTYSYKAKYNAVLSKYLVVDDIDIPVTVVRNAAEPTPTVKPTPVPATLVPTPNAPTPTPKTPTPMPNVPTMAPNAPTMEPNVPTAVPNEPTMEPNVPTATPNEPTATPNTPTATPNEPTATPSTPMPTPLPSTSAPQAPTTTPLMPTPTPMPNIPTPEPPVPAVTPVPPGPATPTPKPDESNLTGNQIEDRTDLSLLLATGKQKGRGVRLTWRKWSGCTGYEVYCSFCDGKRNYKRLKTVSSTGKRVADHKNLKKNRAYKYYVVTYEIKDGRKHYLAKSPIIHVAMNKEPRTNAKSIKLNKKQVTLKKSKAFQIRATVKKENKKKKLLAHEEIFRYYVDDKRVVGLSKKGRIRAKQKGVCTVFVIANNGVAGKMKVIVK